MMMKKLLGIVVLGLLLVGCAPSAYDTNGDDLRVVADGLRVGGTSMAEIKSEANAKCQSLNRGNAINIERHSDEDWAGWKYYKFDCDKSKKIIEAEKKQEEENKKQIELTSMIDKAKDTCKSLGFTEGTDKFSDCSLKLYTQSVELAAKQNQQIVSQGLVSGSNVVTIYDPRRDSRAAIKRGQGLINGTCTLGDLSTC